MCDAGLRASAPARDLAGVARWMPRKPPSVEAPGGAAALLRLEDRLRGLGAGLLPGSSLFCPAGQEGHSEQALESRSDEPA
jgi:hypothetical protein